MDMYLADPSKEISSLNRYPMVKQLFLKTSTALPSSAPVERLFSISAQVHIDTAYKLTGSLMNIFKCCFSFVQTNFDS
jgi:hypothetical protein